MIFPVVHIAHRFPPLVFSNNQFSHAVAVRGIELGTWFNVALLAFFFLESPRPKSVPRLKWIEGFSKLKVALAVFRVWEVSISVVSVGIIGLGSKWTMRRQIVIMIDSLRKSSPNFKHLFAIENQLNCIHSMLVQ